MIAANFSHYNFFKCKFDNFLMVVSTMCPHIKVAELNTLSHGKGITGMSSAVFLMRHYKVKTHFLNLIGSLGHHQKFDILLAVLYPTYMQSFKISNSSCAEQSSSS